jgi:hypothetical protein
VSRVIYCHSNTNPKGQESIASKVAAGKQGKNAQESEGGRDMLKIGFGFVRQTYVVKGL